VVLAGTGTALAATNSIPDSSGVIHACYKPNANGSLSPLGVIDTALPNGKCPANQREVDWNQTGPQGPAGAPGSKVSVITVQHTTDGQIQPGIDIQGSDAVCPAGYTAVGGGFQLHSTQVAVIDSYAEVGDTAYPPAAGQAPTGWHVDVHPTADYQPYPTVQVICASS